MDDLANHSLDRTAREARERLAHTLEALDARGRALIHTASQTGRVAAIGAAGALLISVTWAMTRRTSRSTSVTRSILGDALRLGVLAVAYVGVRHFAQRASEPPRASSAPQLRRVATQLGAALHAHASTSAERAGMTHALTTGSAVEPRQSDHD
jgi:hypothetical protein